MCWRGEEKRRGEKRDKTFGEEVKDQHLEGKE